MEFKDSQTYQNLLNAFQKELQLSAESELNAEIARRDGFIEISHLYQKISDQDQQHALTLLRKITNEELPDTQDNLTRSIEDEYNIANNVYQKYVETAKEEGYEDIRALFAGLANIHYNYESLYRKQLDDVKSDQVFCKPVETIWVCMQCGNIMTGLCAPDICPVCGFPQGFYRVQSVNDY